MTMFVILVTAICAPSKHYQGQNLGETEKSQCYWKDGRLLCETRNVFSTQIFEVHLELKKGLGLGQNLKNFTNCLTFTVLIIFVAVHWPSQKNWTEEKMLKFEPLKFTPLSNSVPFLFNFRTRELKRTFLSGSQDTRGAKPAGSGKGYNDYLTESKMLLLLL